MTTGIAYYNSGCGCLLRLAVSLHSLRRFNTDAVTILHEPDDGAELCRKIAAAFGAEARPVKFEPPVPDGPHYPFVAKTRVPGIAPYDVTILLDADTLIRADIGALYAFVAGPVEFAVPQFANWNTSGKIAKRILGWEPYMPAGWIRDALAFGRAINNGVAVCRKGSPFCAEWADYALAGRALYIPDESSLQVLVAVHPERAAVIDHWWNTSCKYDDPLSPDAKIVHFHGRKHCRLDNGKPVYHSDLWYAELEAFQAKHPALADMLRPTDRHVRQYAAEYAKWRGA